jgi:two-component system, OmpR family, phosphate regulon sensor histidine kinase PhoR
MMNMEQASSKGSVLVIDDEYGVRSGISQILEMEGYEVGEAASGREALAALENGSFDVLLIDYQLPDIDGLTLLRAVRAQKIASMTCMITAYANIDTAIAATRQGIDFFLPKPFSPEDLLGVVETLLRHKQLREETERLRRDNEASLLALATEKSQTRSLVASLRDAVLVVNRDEVVVLANAAMAKLLNCAEQEVWQQPISEVLAIPALAPLREMLARPDDRAVYELEMGERSFLAKVTAYSSANGTALGRILTLAEITELRRMAMEKSRFIRTMVHEFRSPLGAIKSLLEVALDQSLGEGIQPYLSFLERADARVDKLVELIGDLLSLSRIDLERKRGTPVGSALFQPVLDSVVELYRERMETRGISLEIPESDGLPAVSIDPEDLKSILTNLVGNAVKYNRDGGRVSVRAVASDGTLQIEVADTGLGIREDNLPYLFDEFFRERRTETRDIEGNGLGLAIVKRLVERAGGNVSVTSQEGKGSTFRVALRTEKI